MISKVGIYGEITKFATDEDKPILFWLFNRYHFASQWSFVARCSHQRYGKLSYQTNRVWSPTSEGKVLYFAAKNSDNG